jgi:hypothetical protein
MGEVKKDIHDELAETLGKLLDLTVNEAVVLKRLEKFFSPQPANLVETEEQAEELGNRLSELCEMFGGPPAVITINEQTMLPRFDTYAEAAADEILQAFHRCRRGVCRAHMFFIAASFLQEHPNVWKNKSEPEEEAAIFETLRERFWDGAESTYIRIASFWDRVGQLLAFVFFNIRQYERDVFPEVIERIRKNYIPLHQELGESEAWDKLYDYKKSKKVEGFEWLQSRRNLLVHSLRLRPMPDPEEENPIFISAYNHLEKKIREKLKPGTMQEELEYLHSHLRSAATLFPEVIDLCQLGAEIQSRDSKIKYYH